MLKLRPEFAFLITAYALFFFGNDGYALEAPGELKSSVDKPNVVIFLMDDMGYGDCRVYNPDGKVALPNIERLAAEGMFFTDAHSPSAVCAPTRYSVLTGNYPWRGRLPNGTWIFHQPSQVLTGQETLGHLMKRAGYNTGFLGKVHLGGQIFSKSTGKPITWNFDYKDIDFSRPMEDTPASFGFDYAYELPQGIQGSPYVAFENGLLACDESKLQLLPKGKHGDWEIPKSGFGDRNWDSSSVGPTLAKKALAFIDRHVEENEKANQRRPFFMHYCAQSCHTPHTPPVSLDGTKIKGVTGDDHLDMLFEADVILGKIIERLRASGELQNTLFLFTSDNGGLSRGKRGQQRLGHHSNRGLRGGKALIWEGGHRVPLIAKWGDGTLEGSVIKPGSQSDAIVGLQDIFATMSELSCQNVAPDQGLDSQSFLLTLTGDDKAVVRTSLFVQANDEDVYAQRLMQMVREGDWKLITSKKQKPLYLYNLADDLTEKTNLIKAPEQQERVLRMQAELKRIISSKRSTPPLNVSNRIPVSLKTATAE